VGTPPWGNSHIGLRGIIGDKEDKYLLLVNNRIMNDKTTTGDVERTWCNWTTSTTSTSSGTGSSVLGPGAVSMIISISPTRPRRFAHEGNGTCGVIDEYTSLELKHGTK